MSNNKLARYSKFQKIGEGTYGTVYRAKDNFENSIVALKKVKLDDDNGIPATTIREIAILNEIKHPNVVGLKRVFHHKEKLFLVFEYLDMDLKKFMDNYKYTGKLIPKTVVKSLIYQLILALSYCNSHRIIHRDLKPQNILIDSKNKKAKLCDFGSARTYNVPIKTLTREVGTLWYRSPEILMGSKRYSIPVDIWSLGCIFAEIVNLSPLFPGDSEIEVLMKIFQVLGTPTEKTWPNWKELPTFPKCKKNTFKGFNCKIKSKMDPLAFDLLKRMLVINPKNRISAKCALKHPYFNGLS